MPALASVMSECVTIVYRASFTRTLPHCCPHHHIPFTGTAQIVYGSIAALLDVDFGAPLHSLVILGKLHEMEEAYLNQYRVTDETPRLPPPEPADEGKGSSSDSDA